MSNTWTIEQMGMTITTDGAWIVIRFEPVRSANYGPRCVIVASDCCVQTGITQGYKNELGLEVAIGDADWDFWFDAEAIRAIEEEFLAKIIQAKYVARAFDRGR